MYTLRNILNFVFITKNEKVWPEMVYEGSHSPCPLQHLLLFVFFKPSIDQGKMKSLSTFYLLASFYHTRRYCVCDQMGKVMNE